MKRNLFLLFAAVLFAAAVSTESMSQPSTKASMKDQSGNLLRHIVLLKFKDSSTPEQVRQVENAFSALPGKINTNSCCETFTFINRKADVISYYPLMVG